MGELSRNIENILDTFLSIDHLVDSKRTIKPTLSSVDEKLKIKRLHVEFRGFPSDVRYCQSKLRELRNNDSVMSAKLKVDGDNILGHTNFELTVDFYDE